MKTNHIVSKTSTCVDINSGEAVADNFSTIKITKASGGGAVILDTRGFYFNAAALRDMAKLFKKLANALDRPKAL